MVGMLRIEGVELQDFGPFKGHQQIELPEAAGVVVVYGENMRGKTSLLNAIRFALFGKVLGRARREGSLHNIGNWEEFAAGRYGFGVVLRLQSEGQQYRLTRTCRPRDNIVPQGDSDYAVEFFLERDGVVLGPGEAESELERIMPEQIARFFLFDGELLQEYEGLLRSESDMGRQISEAIERILGVPVLTQSRTTLRRILTNLEEEEAKSAQSHTLTRDLGVEMRRLQEKRGGLQRGLDDMRRGLREFNDRKASLESELSRSERLAAVMAKLDVLRGDIARLRDEIEARRSEIAKEMTNAWRALVASRSLDLIQSLRQRESTLQLRKVRLEVLHHTDGPAGTQERCPTCFQPLSEAALAQMATATESESFEKAELEAELRGIQRRLEALEETARATSGAYLRVLWADLRSQQRTQFAKEDEASELDRRLKDADADQDALRRAQSELAQTLKKIGIAEEGIESQEALLAENEANLTRVRTRLEEMGGSDVEGARQRRDLCEALHGLFDDAVDTYRDRLRERVETDATELFLQLTTEPEYTGLSINESYGLTILHRDGSEIPVRSAGAEHVVALSLLGALQRNAPLQGPIFIDSPFGRLDTEHTRNVVAALPIMTEQVCLLVYEEELRPALARDLLRTQLRAEYHMRRISARHTELEEVRGQHG